MRTATMEETIRQSAAKNGLLTLFSGFLLGEPPKWSVLLFQTVREIRLNNQNHGIQLVGQTNAAQNQGNPVVPYFVGINGK